MTTKIKDFTVQDMIDHLILTDDKSIPFSVSIYKSDGSCVDYNKIEYVDTDGKNSDVSLNIHLT